MSSTMIEASLTAHVASPLITGTIQHDPLTSVLGAAALDAAF